MTSTTTAPINLSTGNCEDLEDELRRMKLGLGIGLGSGMLITSALAIGIYIYFSRR
ncbi:unnamed protein product, partial [Rotaria sp. Silwood2]